jgi:hypothetical protein
MVLLAGPEAERRATGRFPEPGNPDHTNALFLANELNAAPDEAEAYVEWLRRRTANLLKDEIAWQAVETLVSALLERPSISYRLARALIAGEPEQPKRRRPRPPRLEIVK